MKVLRGFAIFFLLLGALYLVGPRVETPELNESPVSVPSDLMSLERWITEKENALGNVRSGNASQIIFNDSVPKKNQI